MDSEKQIIDRFSKEMLAKIELRHNRYASMGWKTLDLKRLIWLIKGELAELEQALSEPIEGNALKSQVSNFDKKQRVRDEAIDVANYAMFIWEISK